jgi:hypothetical protein
MALVECGVIIATVNASQLLLVGECPACGWKWGNPETHLIGMPPRQWADD